MFLHTHTFRLAGLLALLLTTNQLVAQKSATSAAMPVLLASAGHDTIGSSKKTKTETDASAAYRTPDYDKPETYTERPIEIKSGEFVLPAILTMPAGKTSVPLVVLVHDAGPHDKDMTVGANKPFRDIALGLAAQGVATVRYDNRTQVYGTEIFDKIPDFTVQQEVVDDAVAAIRFASKLPGINSQKLFVLGHGYGGIMAPRIAQSAPELNGIILMATPVRPVQDYLLERKEYEYSLAKYRKPGDAAALNNLRLQVGNVRSFTLSTNMPSDSLPMGLPASYWLDLREYNQGYVARSLPQRIMVLHPERDYQVTLQDLEMWQRSLHHRGTQYTPVLYSNLNHLMQEGKAGSTPAEFQQPNNVPMYLIRNISTWVRFGL